jgi:hypothetical protein
MPGDICKAAAYALAARRESPFVSKARPSQ